MNTIYVCYTIDKDYESMGLMSICNLIAHKSEDTKLVIYVLDLPNDNLNYNFLYKFGIIKNVEIRIRTLPSELDRKLADISSRQKFAKALYSRWMIPLIPELQKINKILYVDADTFALKDLTALYNTDLEDKAMGICKSQYRMVWEYRTKDTFDKFDPFVNGGVLLLDCKKLNQWHICETMFKELMQLFPYVTDEMVISNKMLDAVKYLPPTENLMYPVLLEKYPYINDIFYWNALHNTNYKSFEDLLKQTDLIHMYGKKINLRTDPKLSKIYNYMYETFMGFLYTEEISTNTEEIDNEIIHI